MPVIWDTELFEIIEVQTKENTMMEHNGADLMANELENYSYKDPVSPKCSPDGPLTQPWSPWSPSSSSLQGQIHEESEETVSTIKQVHISSIQGNLKVTKSQKHFS